MIDEKLIRIANSMIHFLEPEELERFSEAERIEQETKAEITKIIETARAREPLTDWRETMSPEWREIIAEFPENIRGVVGDMDSSELERYADLSEQCGKAQFVIVELLRIAAQRAN